MAVSDPESTSYGKHWSPQEVVEFFAPSEETATSVESWLVRAGIHPSRHTLSANKAWVKMNVTILEAERLLKAKYSAYEHDNGHMTLGVCRELARSDSALTSFAGCDSYSVPFHIRQHIEIISPTLHLQVNSRRSD